MFPFQLTVSTQLYFAEDEIDQVKLISYLTLGKAKSARQIEWKEEELWFIITVTELQMFGNH